MHGEQNGHVPPPPPRRDVPERGPILGYVLASLAFGALLNIVIGFFQWKHAARLARLAEDTACNAHDRRMALVVIVIGIAQAFCVIGMATWKRWGVFGMFSLTFLLLLSNHAAGVHGIPLRPLVMFALLFLAIARRWRHFD